MQHNSKRNEQHKSQNILVTGGAGFIGSNLIQFLLDTHDHIKVVNYDLLTYAGNLANLTVVDKQHKDRHTFIKGDICDQEKIDSVFSQFHIDTVIHLAAESHVDRSIDGPMAFIQTNVVGTTTLLQAARKAWINQDGKRFHHVSTDEVYGSLDETGLFKETTAYDPSSPYSASKASSDHLVRAWSRTFNLPVTISNCSNNYGPYQFPEKLIPLMISNALSGKPLPVYGKGLNVRDWLYVQDHASAINHIVHYGKCGETYNVGGNNEYKNIDIVKLICKILDQIRPSKNGPYENLITYVKDRPGHDHRYAIDASKIQNDLGWTPRETFETGILKTINWYLHNDEWASSIKNKSYNGERLGNVGTQGK